MKKVMSLLCYAYREISCLKKAIIESYCYFEFESNDIIDKYK